MSAKKTREFYENLASQRNHVLMSVSDVDTPSKGNVTILCRTCGKEFTTTAKSYTYARKTGCIHCKSINARLQKPTKKTESGFAVTSANPASIDNKAKKLAIRLKKRALFSDISNLDTLIAYLEKQNNSYSRYIIPLIKRNPDILGDVKKEKHHIIPKHAGGPNSAYNLVYLTPEEHIKAHLYLYESYNEFGDYVVLVCAKEIGKSVEKT